MILSQNIRVSRVHTPISIGAARYYLYSTMQENTVGPGQSVVIMVSSIDWTRWSNRPPLTEQCRTEAGQTPNLAQTDYVIISYSLRV